MQEFRETKLGRGVGRYILTLTYMYNISNVWGQLRKYKIAEQKGVWRPIKCGSTLFESSTEALFVLPLIAQAPKTVGRANYFSLNWKCNFWPLSRLKRRDQAFPLNGIVFSGRLSFQSCGCGAFLCFPLPGPIQLSISWHELQNETSSNQKDLLLFLWFLRQI